MAELKGACFCTWSQAPDDSERNFELLTDISVSRLPIGPIEPFGLMCRLKVGPKEKPVVTIDLYAPNGDRLCHFEAKLDRPKRDAFECFELPAVTFYEEGIHTGKIDLDGDHLKDVRFSVTIGLDDHDGHPKDGQKISQLSMRVKRSPVRPAGKDVLH